MLNKEFIRYVINGGVATLVHYIVLNFNILILDIETVGIANLIAAFFGIIFSFLGSRYFVYRGHNNSIKYQILSFGLLYIGIAVFHGALLYLWTDVYHLNYHYGFVIATLLQVALSYIGNKKMVFKTL